MITLALANRLLDSTLGAGHPVFVSLHINEPGEDGGSELFGGSYRRQAVIFDKARERVTVNAQRHEFLELPEARISHIGVWDAQEGGIFLWGSDRMDPAVQVPDGGTLRIEPGNLAIKMLIR